MSTTFADPDDFDGEQIVRQWAEILADMPIYRQWADELNKTNETKGDS